SRRWPTPRNDTRCGDCTFAARTPAPSNGGKDRASSSRRLPLPGAERGGDLPLVQNPAVVAFDQQRYSAVIIDVLRPAERVVQRGIFLEKPALLLERRHGFGAAGTAINPVSHRDVLLGMRPELLAC